MCSIISMVVVPPASPTPTPADCMRTLHPVTFFYKPGNDDDSHALQYGLIAEEVAKLYPDMVGYDKDGQPSSVKYQSLAPMLLNEVQKQNTQIRSLQERLAALETLLSSQPSTATRPASSQ